MHKHNLSCTIATNPFIHAYVYKTVNEIKHTLLCQIDCIYSYACMN